MPYIGNTIRAADDYRLIDDISSSFNGSTTSFALQVAGSSPVPFPKSPQQVLISVNGVIQEPDPTGASGFNLVGTNIVFSSAPTNGHAFFGIIYATADYLNAGGNFPSGSLGAPSFTFIGDENTGLYRKSGGSVGFVSDATEIANFDSNGITISSGNIIIPDSIIHNGDSNTKIRFPAADTITAETGGSERIRINSAGAVMVGGTLQAGSNGGLNAEVTSSGNHTTALALINQGTADDSGVIISHRGVNDAGNQEDYNYIRMVADDTGNGSEDGSIRFWTLNAGTLGERLRITSTGSVLVGTTSDSIFNDTSGGGFNLKADGQLVLAKQATSAADPLVWLNDTGQTTNKAIVFAQDGSEKANIGLAGNDTTITVAGSERMRINSSGHVGIGTDTPDQLGGGTDSTILAVIESSGTRRGQLLLGDNQNVDTGGIGDIHFVGKYQNSGHKDMACIKAQAAGSTSGQRGAVLIFETKTDGTAAIAERMRIDSSGHILPGADSTYNIGSNSNRFANGYFDTLYGDGSNLTGITTAISSIAGDADNRVIVSDGDGTATCSNQFVFNGDTLKLLGTNNSRAFEVNPGSNAGSMVIDRNGFITSMIRASDGGSNVGGSSGGGSRIHLAKTHIKFDTFPHVSNIGDAVTYTTRASIDTSGNFVPGANNSYSLGTSSLRWSNIFTADLHLSNEGSSNDVDSTWGDYTIQEGFENLFLINNRTGKKFKFNLTEVS